MYFYYFTAGIHKNTFSRHVNVVFLRWMCPYAAVADQMLPLLVASRSFSTFTLLNSFFAQYRMSQKPKEKTDVCRK